MTAPDAQRAIDAVFRIESARLIAGLARMVRDVGLAEELAHDALVAALERWPESGIPDNPGAWLMATAKHRAVDLLRRKKALERQHEELGHELEVERGLAGDDLDEALDDEIGDDLLALVFVACHPVLSTEARVALTLRLLGGLTTARRRSRATPGSATPPEGISCASTRLGANPSVSAFAMLFAETASRRVATCKPDCAMLGMELTDTSAHTASDRSSAREARAIRGRNTHPSPRPFTRFAGRGNQEPCPLDRTCVRYLRYSP
jgi:DNA-directed RNA polymerase specialized sigma24 family protein